MQRTSSRVVRCARLSCITAVAAVLWGASADAALLTYRWQQTGCTGDVCSTDISGNWVFDAAAVQRGTATFLAVPEAFPQIDPHEVDSFTFTIGRFSVKGIEFGPLTWTNANAVNGLAVPLLGTYRVTFSADRQRIAGLSQSTASGALADPTATTFERAPRNPSIGITVQPQTIFFQENTGSEPRVDGIPVTPHATLTGSWVLASPVPEPRVAGLFVVGLGLLALRWGRGSWRAAKPN